MTADLDRTLAVALARGRPTLYFDTNVLVDILRTERRLESRQLLEECLSRSWTCVSSTFALMEALDVEQENRWARIKMGRGPTFDRLMRQRRDRDLSARVLTNVYKRLVRELDKRVKFLQPDLSVWEDAIRLAINTNSSAPDCIHVAAARSCRCDVLVTSDRPLRRTAAGEIEVATPEAVLSWLQTAGV